MWMCFTIHIYLSGPVDRSFVHDVCPECAIYVDQSTNQRVLYFNSTYFICIEFIAFILFCICASLLFRALLVAVQNTYNSGTYNYDFNTYDKNPIMIFWYISSMVIIFTLN